MELHTGALWGPRQVHVQVLSLATLQIHDLVAAIHFSNFIHCMDVSFGIQLIVFFVMRNELLKVFKEMSETCIDSSGSNDEHSLLVGVGGSWGRED